MSGRLAELEAVMQQLVAEHQKLLGHMEQHQAAMKTLDLVAMEQAARLQEAARLRIGGLEQRRRALVKQLAGLLRMAGTPTLAQLAEASPQSRDRLLALRDALRKLAEQIAARLTVASRLATGLLGHLNTAVRLLAGAVEHAGVYTKHGIPQVSSRIGVMEAVG